MYRSRKSLLSLSSIAVLMVSAAISRAITRNVPSTAYPTIQSAIHAAIQGDTILVASGTYRESLTIVNKNLTPLPESEWHPH
jgi:hypothetical protein